YKGNVYRNQILAHHRNCEQCGDDGDLGDNPRFFRLIFIQSPDDEIDQYFSDATICNQCCKSTEECIAQCNFSTTDYAPGECSTDIRSRHPRCEHACKRTDEQGKHYVQSEQTQDNHDQNSD